MYLAHVDIHNFRSLKSLSVDLQQGLNVLVGRNNVGKTSFLSAIRHALGAQGGRGDALWLSEDDFFRATPNDARATEIEVVLTYRGLTDRERSFFYEIVDFDHSAIDSSPAVIRFTATWNEARRRATVRRTGGPAGLHAPDVPSEILAALSVTFLPALRDAEEQLAPGPRSRLAQMLRDISLRGGDAQKDPIEQIFREANSKLEEEPLLTEAQSSLRGTTELLSGSDYSKPAIRAAGISFERILRSLQVLMPGAAVEGLHANGLGFNNLLYIAVVLEHLRVQADDECPLLMVEEPEAHLHPQLTTLLAKHLAAINPGGNPPQTIISTHSPTLAAAVPIERMVTFFADPDTKQLRANALANCSLDLRESAALSRMMDVTRASMLFAKGLILVEGICEALLVPALASRMGVDLAKEHIAVIPICGVAFATFRKLLGPAAFGIRAAIITDADPAVEGDRWQDMHPARNGDQYQICPRTQKLMRSFESDPLVRVYHSTVTLEYDLAKAGFENAAYVADAWSECLDGPPRTLTRDMVTRSGMSCEEKALVVWRGVCKANSTGSKADLAQHLTAMLLPPQACIGFEVPTYIKEAVRYVSMSPSLPLAVTETDVNAHADS